jgi:hypothetical protein
MPSITFKADVISPSGFNDIANVRFKWKMKIEYTKDIYNSSQETITKWFPETGEELMDENVQTWIPDFGTSIVGGKITVYVIGIYQGIELPAEKNIYKIQGENPTQSQIFGVLNDVKLQVICWEESKHRQFSGTRYTGKGDPLPNSTGDGGYGLMQLTNPTPSEKQMWEWDSNAQGGISIWNTKVTTANNYYTTTKVNFPEATTWTQEEKYTEVFQLYNGGHAYTWKSTEYDQWGNITIQGYWKRTFRTYGEDLWDLTEQVQQGNPPW